MSSSPYSSDEFTSGVTGTFESISKHTKGLAIFAGLVILVAAGVAIKMSQKDAQTDAGRSALFSAQKNLDEQLKKIAQASAPAEKSAVDKSVLDKAGATKTPPAKAAEVSSDAVAFDRFDVDAKLGDSVKALQAVTQDYPKTRPAYEAMMLLGKLYLDHGQTAPAATWFQKATEIPPSSLDKALAFSSEGYALENAGKYKEAISAFDQALNQGEGVLKGDLLLSKARSFQGLGDNAQAKSIYDQIITQLAATEFAKTAEALKARIQ